MSHEIEDNNAFYGGGVPAWHGLGTVIPEDVVQTDRALVLAGLDWQVKKVPFRPQIEAADLDWQVEGDTVLLEAPDRMYITVRSSDNKVLGCVGEQYKVFNNEEAFAFGDSLVETDAAKWHTAGSLYGGTKTWMLMKLPQYVEIAGMDSERVELYICFQNSHDGSGSIKAFITPVRVVCQNTLGWALGGTPRIVTVRHTTNLAKYVAKAQEALGIGYRLLDQMEDEANALLERAFSDADFTDLLDHLKPLPDEDAYDEASAYKRVNAKVEASREKLREIYYTTDDLNNIRGTAYGALQAVIENHDHHMPARQSQVTSAEERRFSRIVSGGAVVQKARDYLVEV